MSSADDIFWRGYNSGYTAGFEAQRRMGDTCLACGSSGPMGPGSVQQPSEPHTCEDCAHARTRARWLGDELERVQRLLQSALQRCHAMGQAPEQARGTVVRTGEARPNHQVVGRDADQPSEGFGANFVGSLQEAPAVRTSRQAPAYRKLSIGFGVQELDAANGAKE